MVNATHFYSLGLIIACYNNMLWENQFAQEVCPVSVIVIHFTHNAKQYNTKLKTQINVTKTCHFMTVRCFDIWLI